MLQSDTAEAALDLIEVFVCVEQAYYRMNVFFSPFVKFDMFSRVLLTKISILEWQTFNVFQLWMIVLSNWLGFAQSDR